MASYPCLCSNAPSISPGTAFWVGYLTIPLHWLELCVFIDSLVRVYYNTTGNQQIRKLYYVINWILWPLIIVIQPILKVYTPDGANILSGCPAPGMPPSAGNVCAPAFSLLYDSNNVWGYPDRALIVSGSYLVLTSYWEKQDFWNTPAWSWSPLAWRAALIFVYVLGQMVLGRTSALLASVNMITLVLISGLFIWATRYWTPWRLFPVAPPEARAWAGPESEDGKEGVDEKVLVKL